MDSEFIYWSHHTPIGIKVEEVEGHASISQTVWREMAIQILCEHGKEGYREIGHFKNGAPFIFGLEARISITHTEGLVAMAMLPRTPDMDLSIFNPRTAMGIDAERLNRAQVVKLRERFLSERELELIPADDVKANILAWTCKEALYKAGMTEGLDWRRDIEILTLPEIDPSPVSKENREASVYGNGLLRIKDERGEETVHEMLLYSYESSGCCVTIAHSPKCAKFSRK